MATILGTDGNDILTGTDGDETIAGLRGDDRIIGSKGNDILTGYITSFAFNNPSPPKNIDILDYSNLGRPVKLILSKFFDPDLNSNNGSKSRVDKSGFGLDIVEAFTQIIGTTNKNNQIDGRAVVNGESLNINLANNFFIRSFRGDKIEIKNFVDAIGTAENDTIVGANKNGKLTGGGGNDIITGGNRNDIITGSDSTARGVGEVDTLTGGGGRDKFVLGDSNGAYYVGKGKDDYATITDFNLFQDSIDLGGFKNYSFASGGGNTIELYSGKDVNTRDLIAKIQLAGGISTASSNSRSVMGFSGIDAITSKIDLLSGSNSINA
jgi:Ca2+-binding RTX toxin-like protein